MLTCPFLCTTAALGGPDSAVLDVDADVPFVVHDSCSYSARSLTRSLCATTEVIVQTVQFLDKVVAMPFFLRQVHGSRCA